MNQTSQCETNKKCFQTEGDAIKFEIENRQRNNLEKQHAYLCEVCGFYHLSALPPGDNTRSRVNYGEASKYVVRARRTPEEQLKLREEILELTRQGMAAQAIADKLQISPMTVYNMRSGKMTGALSKTVQGIEVRQLSIQEQIAKLQAELVLEEKRKQEIIEARQLKVQWSEVEGGDRILVITQDQNRFSLTPEDAAKLHELLEETLKAVC
jgi:DNA-binding CsgD family transcriptional regulator